MFYGTAAGFTEYHTARGRNVTDHTTPAIETALLVASEWLDGSFTWPGFKAGTRTTQERDWPRSYVMDRDGHAVDYTAVPTEIEQATYEAALRHLADETALLVDYTPDKYKRVTIEGAVSVEYRALDAQTVQRKFPIIGQILARLLGGRSDQSPLSSSIVRV